ncbi:MAG: DNA recombination protein RmuC [Pseudomonadota bacterium]|nr:DNA recombination protein RmuC [Pseudomonadota bacterium]
MDNITIGLAIALVMVGGIAVMALYRGGRLLTNGEQTKSDISRIAEAIAAGQNDLAGRLTAITETSTAAQSELTKTLNDRLDAVSKRLGDGLEASSEKTTKTMTDLRERLVRIDAAQKNIAELSGQVVSLQEVLSNKQARGAFGEIQLNDLITNILPPSAYQFQATLGNGTRCDCLLTLPNPPGAIAIDAKFPLESYHALRNADDEAAKTVAERAFHQAIVKHIDDISGKYIIPGETAESALMFLPSEAVYAELHATFGDVVEKSYRARVWIVSPTTLMATLNTVRAVLKDARMREQAGVIQRELLTLLKDVERLDDRVEKLQIHFEQATKDISQIRISTAKVTSRAERIEDIQLEDATPAEDLNGPRLVDSDTGD